MFVIEVAFWTMVAVLLYAYLGYPLLIFVLASLVQTKRDFQSLFARPERRAELPAAGDLPRVSIITPAYNEERAMPEKLANCLALDYPREKLEIIVASDGSTDGTNGIVESFAESGILLAAHQIRRGKPSVINDTVERAAGDILVLTDATSILDPDSVRMAVRHFRDPAVGAVSGEVRLVSPDIGYKGESLYWRYEVMLKFLENRLGVVLGSSGSLCAVRKSAYRAIPADCICDDLVITLNTVMDGHRAIYDPEVRSTEMTSSSVELERLRRIRIAAGNFQALGLTVKLLSPLRGWVALCYLSHKVLKWTSWAFMAAAFVANLMLVYKPLYVTLLALQVAFYGSATIKATGARLPVLDRLAGATYYFVSMQLAMLQGFIRHLRGTQPVAWDRQHR